MMCLSGVAEAEQEAGAHPGRARLRSVLASLQVFLLTSHHDLVCSMGTLQLPMSKHIHSC